MADTNVSAPSFALDRYDLEDDRLVVEGRWFDVRGRRFVRPVLTTEDRRRAIAVLDHKPWVPEDGRTWVAAFRLSGVPAAGRLQVAPDLAIDLPTPGPRAGGGDPQPARVARVDDPSERAEAPVTLVEEAPPAEAAAPEPPVEAPAAPPGARERRARGAGRRSRGAPADWGATEWTVTGRERPGAVPARPAGEPPPAVLEDAEADGDTAGRPAAKAPPEAAAPAPAPAVAAAPADVGAGAAANRVAAEHAAAERARAEAAEEIRELRALLGRAQQALHALRGDRDRAVESLRAERDAALGEIERLRDAGADVRRMREQMQETRAEIEVLGRLARQANERAAEAERQRDVLARARERDVVRAAETRPPADAGSDAPPRPRWTAPARDVAEAPAPDPDEGPIGSPRRAGAPPGGRRAAAAARARREAPGAEQFDVGHEREAADGSPEGPDAAGRREAPDASDRHEGPGSGARRAAPDARDRHDGPDASDRHEAPDARDLRAGPEAGARRAADGEDSAGEQPAAAAPGPSATRRTIQIGEPPPPGAVPMPPSVFGPPAGAPGGRPDWRVRSLTIIAWLLFAAAILVLLVGVL